jgi:hypothetical protein
MQGYVSNYTWVTDTLNLYLKRTKYQEAIRVKAAELHDRDLASFLITPAQRMPRPMLFIREVLKFTPELRRGRSRRRRSNSTARSRG